MSDSAPTTSHGVRTVTLTVAIFLLPFVAPRALADKNYAPGVTDSEIKIGQTMPYSGPASAYSAVGKAEAAYFKMINDQGGVNGRKIHLISLDDGYSPPKTIEQIRKLVEQDEVALIFASLGTAPNTVIRKYLNDRKIPQLFIHTAAAKFNDPQHFPWTVPALQPSYHAEGVMYGKYILRHAPNAKVAILYQNDDYGKDYVSGLKDGLGQKAATMIAAEASYEVTDPTIDSQIVTLQSSGADTFYDVTSAKFASQAIRKIYNIGWRPTHILNSPSAYFGAVFEPAGLDASSGIISATAVKDVTDPHIQDDPAYQEWLAWMQKYNPQGNVLDTTNVGGYIYAQTLVQVLEVCGDDLSRENILHEATNLHNLALPMLLPGVAINTSPIDYEPIKQMYIRQFTGKTWEILEMITAQN